MKQRERCQCCAGQKQNCKCKSATHGSSKSPSLPLNKRVFHFSFFLLTLRVPNFQTLKALNEECANCPLNRFVSICFVLEKKK